jgi:hypothetical protein
MVMPLPGWPPLRLSSAAMRTLSVAGGLAALLSLVACGGDDAEPVNPDGTQAVSSEPLSGTIDGRSFTAVSALAFNSGFESNERFVSIYDIQRACEESSRPPVGSRHILMAREWTPRSEPLSLRNNVTFVLHKEGGPDNLVVTRGRLELLDTPAAKGTTGTLRLRAVLGSDRVEGEVSVRVCD